MQVIFFSHNLSTFIKDWNGFTCGFLDFDVDIDVDVVVCVDIDIDFCSFTFPLYIHNIYYIWTENLKIYILYYSVRL